MPSKSFAAGASASIHKTITEIETFLQTGKKRPNTRLRPFLHKLVAELCESAYRKGFNRGHIQSRNAERKKGYVPRRLEFEAQREFFPRIKRTVRAVSRIE